ncbi:uncharacterized protein [Choristoneura fumiferana]|uniref:uncharacterized protein n=1 Tax=Choristoneura fumiferana TaxID=7141 RepID=UPI003D1590AB
MSVSGTSTECACTAPSEDSSPPLTPACQCPRDDHDIVVHDEMCLLYKNETMIYQEPGECDCCLCPLDKCRCMKAGRRDGVASATWAPCQPCWNRHTRSCRSSRPRSSTSSRRKNAIAEEEILNLRDELRLSKLGYEKDLETIYRDDHDTNAQRSLIEEYEATLAQNTADRTAMERRAREANERYKQAKQKLEQDTNAEREATEELEALTSLCRQLEAWREETESELTVSQRMSDKMRAEKKAMADEKRELDMVIYGNNNWQMHKRRWQ